MTNLFENSIEKNNKSFKVDELALYNRTKYLKAEVELACSFLNQYFEGKLNDISALKFRNGYCAYYAAMLKQLFNDGLIAVGDGHAVFVANTDCGIMMFDSLETLEYDSNEYGFYFDLQHDINLIVKYNREEMEKLCIEAVNAFNNFYKKQTGEYKVK